MHLNVRYLKLKDLIHILERDPNGKKGGLELFTLDTIMFVPFVPLLLGPHVGNTSH
jgi:hypothetical protein